MTDLSLIEKQELYAALAKLEFPAKTLYQILKTSLFNHCTVDIFVDQYQYRIENANFTPRQGTVDIALPQRFRRKIAGVWQATKGTTTLVEQCLHLEASVLAPHNSHGTLLFVSIAPLYQRQGSKYIRFVLFREGYELTDESLQVVGWHDAINPIIGTLR